MKLTAFVYCLAFIVLPNFAKAQISGTVSLLGKQEITKPANRGPYGRTTKSNSEKKSENTGIVVYISSKDNATKPNKNEEQQTLNQKDIQFFPRLIVVYQGQSVRVLNSDPVYHNVFSLSKTKSFDIGRRQKGEFKDVVFETPGIVQVFCDIHSHMNAEIVVLQPNVIDFQILSEGQKFSFDVEPGSYSISVYASGYELYASEIEVSNSQNDLLNIQLKP